MVTQTDTKNLNLEIVKEKLRQQPQILEQFQVKTLALFGSTVRNEAIETSDLDFLVEFQGELTLKIYMQLKFYLEEKFNKKVDLVIKSDLKPQIKENIIKEAINIYAS